MFSNPAEIYDARAGLPAQVSDSLLQFIVSLKHLREGDLLLEIGAGTGSIGCSLRALAATYLGLDLSLSMLRGFQAKAVTITEGNPPLIAQADANKNWPVRDRSTRMIFSSRAIHLLDKKHVLQEMTRVAHPDGCLFLMGFIGRNPDSPKVAAQKEMRRLLQSKGYFGHGGGSGRRKITELLEQAGAERVQRKTIASWTAHQAPAHSLQSWRSKEGLDGLPVPDRVKEEVLAELEQWLQNRFKDISKPIPQVEEYLVEAFLLPQVQKVN